MRIFTHLLILLTVFTNGLSHAQRSKGYVPMPTEKYESVRIPFMSSGSTTSLPVNYVISEEYFPNPGDQGEFGSCVAWATGYAFASFYFSVKNNWGKPSDYSKIMSPSYIYHQIRECNCGPDCGTYISDALELLKTRGVVSWQKMPYDERNCVPPGQEMFNAASEYKIKGYNRLMNKMNFNEYKKYLSNDVPVIIGASLGANFDYYRGGRGNTSSFKCTQLEENSGHAMLMVGYDDEKKAFKIMNSWGKDWGDNGYVWVDYECFKLMMGDSGGEAYVVSKDYEIPSGNQPVADPFEDVSVPDSPQEVPDEVAEQEFEVLYDDFHPFGYYEELAEEHYFVTYGMIISEHVQPYVERIVYVFDDPDFLNKYVRSTEFPYFQTAYEGPYCLEEMKAIVVMKDGRKFRIDFDGCEILEHEDSYESDYVEIIPVVTSGSSSQNPGYYDFDIRLRGTEELKEHIVKVVYDYNHPSFSNRFVTVTDSRNGYRTGYSGWGCLSDLGVVIYFDDGTTETFTIDMCDLLGWQ